MVLYLGGLAVALVSVVWLAGTQVVTAEGAVAVDGPALFLQGLIAVVALGSGLLISERTTVSAGSRVKVLAGFAPQAAYSATKAAVLGLTRDLAAQWGSRRGIRVNSLAPGYFASEMTDEIPEKMLADITGSTLFGRLGLQPELDSALVFLASDASSFITGATLVVDGGMTMH